MNLINRALAVLVFSGWACASNAAIVTDGGFEGGIPNAAWTTTSTNFGSTLCDLGSCGTGTGTGPNSGDYWSWFGGIPAYEQGTISQQVTIPNGTAQLSFFLENIISDSNQDYLRVFLDGTQVFQYLGGGALDGILGYTQQSVNIDSFADGGTHTLLFESEIFAANGGFTNFFVDDVSITEVPLPPAFFLLGSALLGLGALKRKKA